MRQNKYEYDAFISHAVEDKIPIANELCARLERAGLKIWYSGKELGIGDSIEKTIQKGLTRSRYGIVIFSPTYLAKNWTIREFYTLLAKEIDEQKVILPVLYNITLDDLKNKDLVMADRFGVNADRGMDYVVEKLVREIKMSNATKPRYSWAAKLWFVLILSLFTNLAFIFRSVLFPDMGTHSHLHSPLTDAEGKQHIFLNQVALFETANGFYKRINACPCNVDKGQTGDPSIFGSAVQKNNVGSVMSNSGYADINEAFTENLKSRDTGLTIALFFQMENLPANQKGLNGHSALAESTVLSNADSDVFQAYNLALGPNSDAIQCAHLSCRQHN